MKENLHNFTQIEDAIKFDIENSGKQIQEIAMEMDLRPSEFSQKYHNNGNNRHFFKPSELAKLVQITKGKAIPGFLAGLVGCELKHLDLDNYIASSICNINENLVVLLKLVADRSG